MLSKQCGKCKEYKWLHEFNSNPKGKYGKHSNCKHCQREYSKRYYNDGYKEKRKESKRNKEPYKSYYQYLNMLWTYYRLREEHFQELMNEQKGCCAICNESLVLPEHSNNNCHVDHCHSTGVTRGLLCGRCNAMIGYAKDNPEILQSGINYLVERLWMSR